jgi:serine/threonine protein kinase
MDFKQFLKTNELANIDGFEYVGQLLGGGTSFSAIYAKDKTKAVAKFFFAQPIGGSVAMARELKIMRICNQRDDMIVPKILAEFSSPDKVVHGFLMEFVDGKILEECVPPTGIADIQFATGLFYRIGWAYHHGIGPLIYHGDLHPKNIMIEVDHDIWFAEKREHPGVRILDLGSAVAPVLFQYDETFDEDWWKQVQRRFNGAFYCVAPEFFSPDYFKTLVSSGTTDCWALGLLLYRMCTGKTITVAGSIGEYVDNIRTGQLQRTIAAALKENIKDYYVRYLIESMLKIKPSERINMTTATTLSLQISLNDSNLIGRTGSSLHEYVYVMGCDPEHYLPPHERENSPY